VLRRYYTLVWSLFPSTTLCRSAAEGAAVEDVLHLPCACIGGTTSAAARESGFTQVLEAREATAAGVVETIEERMMRDA
jgi:uroporphyrinogen-III synthase